MIEQVEVYCWKISAGVCSIMWVSFHHLQKSPQRIRLWYIYIYSTKPKVVVVSDAFYETKLIGKKDFQSCQWNISTMMTASLPLDDFSTILDKSENESISEVFKLTDHLAWSSISFPTFLPYYEVLLPWLQKVFVLFLRPAWLAFGHFSMQRQV